MYWGKRLLAMTLLSFLSPDRPIVYFNLFFIFRLFTKRDNPEISGYAHFEMVTSCSYMQMGLPFRRAGFSIPPKKLSPFTTNEFSLFFFDIWVRWQWVEEKSRWNLNLSSSHSLLILLTERNEISFPWYLQSFIRFQSLWIVSISLIVHLDLYSLIKFECIDFYIKKIFFPFFISLFISF